VAEITLTSTGAVHTPIELPVQDAIVVKQLTIAGHLVITVCTYASCTALCAAAAAAAAAATAAAAAAAAAAATNECRTV
jgi:hypothetical protein